MPTKYEVTYNSKGKDIQLPNESKSRDKRLPPSPAESLRALRDVAGTAKKNADEFKRRYGK